MTISASFALELFSIYQFGVCSVCMGIMQLWMIVILCGAGICRVPLMSALLACGLTVFLACVSEENILKFLVAIWCLMNLCVIIGIYRFSYVAWCERYNTWRASVNTWKPVYAQGYVATYWMRKEKHTWHPLLQPLSADRDISSVINQHIALPKSIPITPFIPNQWYDKDHDMNECSEIHEILPVAYLFLFWFITLCHLSVLSEYLYSI